MGRGGRVFFLSWREREREIRGKDWREVKKKEKNGREER